MAQETKFLTANTNQSGFAAPPPGKNTKGLSGFLKSAPKSLESVTAHPVQTPIHVALKAAFGKGTTGGKFDLQGFLNSLMPKLEAWLVALTPQEFVAVCVSYGTTTFLMTQEEADVLAEKRKENKERNLNPKLVQASAQYREHYLSACKRFRNMGLNSNLNGKPKWANLGSCPKFIEMVEACRYEILERKDSMYWQTTYVVFGTEYMEMMSLRFLAAIKIFKTLEPNLVLQKAGVTFASGTTKKASLVLTDKVNIDLSEDLNIAGLPDLRFFYFVTNRDTPEDEKRELYALIVSWMCDLCLMNHKEGIQVGNKSVDFKTLIGKDVRLFKDSNNQVDPVIPLYYEVLFFWRRTLKNIIRVLKPNNTNSKVVYSAKFVPSK